MAGAAIDIGFSDVYRPYVRRRSTRIACGGSRPADFLGPVQAMTVAVPTASTENTISAEAAYMVFGFAAAAPANTIAPWSLPGDIYVRFWDSGTLEMIGVAIGLPGSKWANATNKTSARPGRYGPHADGHPQGRGATAIPNTTIGILSTSGLKTGIKALAFQGKGQECSYLPDSSASATTRSTSARAATRSGDRSTWSPTSTASASRSAELEHRGRQTLINALISTSQALPPSEPARRTAAYHARRGRGWRDHRRDLGAHAPASFRSAPCRCTHGRNRCGGVVRAPGGLQLRLTRRRPVRRSGHLHACTSDADCTGPPPPRLATSVTARPSDERPS